VPDHRAHLEKAKANAALYLAMRNNGLPADWQAVILFYSAVHYAEALADLDGYHNETHGPRETYLRTHHPENFWVLYDHLRSESVKARYLTSTPQDAGVNWRKGAFTMTAEQIHLRLYLIALEGIRKYTEKKVAERGITTRPTAAASVKAR
jgi:hypothetical protein